MYFSNDLSSKTEIIKARDRGEKKVYSKKKSPSQLEGGKKL